MSRRIAIRTKIGVRFYDLKTDDRPVTIIGTRLYRTDEKYMLANKTADDEFCLYDLDSAYPYCVEPCAPDETMAYLDIVKTSGQKIKSLHSWPKWLNWNTMVFAILGIVIGWQLISKYMGGGA